MKPTVTVLVDTYNHEKFIEEALTSVVEQKFPPTEMEIIVVDDGSTDRTPDLVRRFEPQVRLIRKKNGGQASAFNVGIPEVRGEFVSFLDGDDWWYPQKLSRVVETIARDPLLGIVGHGITMVHPDGREQSETLLEGFRFRGNTLEGAKLFRLRRSFLGTSRMTIRSALLPRVGPVPEALKVQADEYVFTLAAVLADVRVLPDCLTYYRFHDSNRYQTSTCDPSRMNTKYASLDALASNLGNALEMSGIDPRAKKAITGLIRAEANQMKLRIYGGTPLETCRTEWEIYRVHNPMASALHTVLKAMSLLPALVLSSRAYYELRPRLLQSHIFRRIRDSFVPDPADSHVENTWRPAGSGLNTHSDAESLR